jgi:hypothetical protein
LFKTFGRLAPYNVDGQALVIPGPAEDRDQDRRCGRGTRVGLIAPAPSVLGIPRIHETRTLLDPDLEHVAAVTVRRC